MVKNIGKYSLKDGKILIELARKSIESGFKNSEKNKEEIKIPNSPKFKQARGVFITLYSYPEKNLRGCIGYPYPDFPIAEAVIKAAKSAALSDYRFKPLTKDEINKIIIEISILTSPQEIKNKNNVSKKIKIGEDGLIIKYMSYNGLLLPQVATEHNMNKLEFLEALCQKARLPKDIWQDKNCKLFKFQAQIFKEISPDKKIMEK